MSHASLTINGDATPMTMEVAFSDGDYNPEEVPHALIAYCWNLVRDSSDALAQEDAKADAPQILTPFGLVPALRKGAN